MAWLPRHRLPMLALLALLAVTWLAYSPGLAGGFLFDDFVNLDAIGATGPVNNWPAFLRYLTSGTADPTGRPLALLSFLIDARDWPAEPGPFLRTNLLLHLLNGGLLFALLRSLGRWLDPADSRAEAAALIGCGAWLLHPLLVSTTLYIVQREAMLPATFVLLGLLAYVRGRVQQERGETWRAAAWMVSGIIGGTALAVLCKGNGVLLPLLGLVLEFSVLSRRAVGSTSAPSRRPLVLALLVLPSLALFAYLASFLANINTPLPVRGWTVGQRLLTEARVLADYMQLLVVPRSVSTGLYNDAYVVSTGLFNPTDTLPSVLLVLSLAALGIACRRTLPALSAALLFFLAGQLLESSVIPLEIYFEHRNYLPSMLLFWPLGRAICAWRVGMPLRVTVSLTLLLVFAVTTWQRASLWGNPQQLASLWALQNPDSSRAQATIAMTDTRNGTPELALRRLAPLWRKHPADLQLAFNYVDAACAARGLSDAESQALETALEQAVSAQQMMSRWLGLAIDAAASGTCQGLEIRDARAWVTAMERNPALSRDPSWRQDIEPLEASLAIASKQPDLALVHFNLSLRSFPTPDVAARQASTLARSGYYRQALAHLDVYEGLKDTLVKPGLGMPWVHARVLKHQRYWPREMAILRAKLLAELQSVPAQEPSAP